MNKVKSQRGWRVFLGSFILLLISYVIYFVRYPIWGWTVEPIFAVLILSYAIVLVTSLALLKKDLKKPPIGCFWFSWFKIGFAGSGIRRSFSSSLVRYHFGLGCEDRTFFVSNFEGIRILHVLFFGHRVYPVRSVCCLWSVCGRGCLQRICANAGLGEIRHRCGHLCLCHLLFSPTYPYFSVTLD